MAARGEAGRSEGRRRLRALLLAGVVALYALSIPWYRTPGAETGRWLGLPEWVAVALVCYAAAALLNAGAWLLSDFEDEDREDGQGEGPGA